MRQVFHAVHADASWVRDKPRNDVPQVGMLRHSDAEVGLQHIDDGVDLGELPSLASPPPACTCPKSIDCRS
jgi:hypothetical protein